MRDNAKSAAAGSYWHQQQEQLLAMADHHWSNSSALSCVSYRMERRGHGSVVMATTSIASHTDRDTKQKSFDGSPSVLSAINDNHKPNIRLMKTTTTQHAILVSLYASRFITSNTLHDSR